MQSFAHVFAYVLGVAIIIAGIRTIFTQQATLTIRLWGDSSNSPTRDSSEGYSTSEHTGFVAILIGIGEIGTGILMLIKGPGFFAWQRVGLIPGHQPSKSHRAL
ncbi:MAG: hypothetical protein RKP46_09845 [Candidatus Accumulibacter sp.]|uniref:hypothetical protein n=1 Tax=Accumulibacter sp. TaxID=2053492 RepID=UPI0028795A26|nr:hypothetical protein [Accumulibacter sp.]MDS4014645.1 hypothetical protein [Accumulibacter sp.]